MKKKSFLTCRMCHSESKYNHILCLFAVTFSGRSSYHPRFFAGEKHCHSQREECCEACQDDACTPRQDLCIECSDQERGDNST